MSDRSYLPPSLTFSTNMYRAIIAREYTNATHSFVPTSYRRSGSFIFNITKGLQGFDWENDDIRAMLVTTEPSQDADFLNDASIVELTTTITVSYSRITVNNRSRILNNIENRVELLAGDLNFNSLESGETVQGVLIHKHITDDTDSIPLFYLQIPLSQRDTSGYPFFISNKINRGHLVYIN